MWWSATACSTLVPDKKKPFGNQPGAEARRTFSISDIVLVGELLDSISRPPSCMPAAWLAQSRKTRTSAWCGKPDSKTSPSKRKGDLHPDDILAHTWSPEQLEEFKHSGTGIYSITVYAERKDACCDKDTCCK